MNYYVYAYLDERQIINQEIYGFNFKYRPIYIGKGKNKRMYDHFNDRKRFNTMFYNKLNKMIKEGNNPLVIKVKEFYKEEDALFFEKELISIIKNIKNGGLLYNLSEGGIGNSGYKHTEEYKKRRREISIREKHHLFFPQDQKGDKHPMYGKKHTEETRQKMSIKRKTRITTEETRKKMSESHKGKKLTEEHKKNLSESQKGRKLTEDHKETTFSK